MYALFYCRPVPWLPTIIYEIKPDAGLFGFNHPNPGMREDGKYGYEDWVTIPEDMEVPENGIDGQIDLLLPIKQKSK